MTATPPSVVDWRMPPNPDAAAGRLEVQEEDADDLAEAHGEDKQVDTFDAERGEPHGEAGEGGGEAARGEGHRERHAPPDGEHRRDVGADRHEPALAEREQPGRDGQGEAQRQHDVDAEEDQHRLRVLIDHTRSSTDSREPNSPCGRNSRIPIIMAKAKASR